MYASFKVCEFCGVHYNWTRHYDHITPAFQHLKRLPVQDMLKIRDAAVAFKCMKELTPLCLCEKFKSDQKIGLHLHGQRTLHFRAITLWITINYKMFRIFTPWGIFKSKYKTLGQAFTRVRGVLLTWLYITISNY